ncbi:MAG: hypothetical protein KGJ93_03015 [Patescibacteria group bacterium]|nr:hypothetical protein [Patescibacteria group bacterium]
MEEELQKLGLSEFEARVYLAALSLGPSTPRQLADLTKIKRPTVYMALEHLVKLGLAYEIKGRRLLFAMEKPVKLSRLTKRLRRRAIDAELVLESILPGLERLPKQRHGEPRVEFYNGIEGLKNVALEIAACPVSWYFFGSGEKILEKLTKLDRKDILAESWALRERESRPKIYLITDTGVLRLGKDWQKLNTPWREVKIVPKLIEQESGLFVCQDKIAIMTFQEQPFAAVVQNRETAEMVRLMLQLIWKSLD